MNTLKEIALDLRADFKLIRQDLKEMSSEVYTCLKSGYRGIVDEFSFLLDQIEEDTDDDDDNTLDLYISDDESVEDLFEEEITLAIQVPIPDCQEELLEEAPEKAQEIPEDAPEKAQEEELEKIQESEKFQEDWVVIHNKLFD